MKIDTEKLTEILILSGRTESLQREAFCQDIGFKIGTMPNAMSLSKDDFGKRLIKILVDRQLVPTLKKLCETLEPYFPTGKYKPQLREIETQLNSTDANNKSEPKGDILDVGQEQQKIQKLEAKIKSQQEEIERLKSENSQLIKTQQKLIEIEKKYKALEVVQLAQYESGIRNLSKIIIACHQIENPLKTSLGKAVEENFKKGIPYIFLVSNSKYQSELNLYYKIYHSIAEIVQEQTKQELRVEDLVQIKRLAIEWDSYPYIFYKLKEDEQKIEKTFVYRGDDEKQGICSQYYPLDIKVAPVVYSLLNSSVDWDEEEKQKVMSITPNEYKNLESEDLYDSTQQQLKEDELRFKLVELLKLSERTEQLRRKTLCQDIGFDMGNVPNAMSLSKNDFGKTLITTLFNRKLKESLDKLCETLKPDFPSEPYHDELIEVRNQLRNYL